MKLAAQKKISVPGANNWVLAAEATELRLRLIIDGKKMPSYREQNAVLHKLAAELEMRSDGPLQDWIIYLEPSTLAGGDKRQIGIRIETATDSPVEAALATAMLKQIANEIRQNTYRFH